MLTLLDEKDWPQEVLDILSDVYDIRTDTEFFIDKADYGYVVLCATPEPIYICERVKPDSCIAVFLDLEADTTNCLGIYTFESSEDDRADQLSYSWATYTRDEVMRITERVVGPTHSVEYGRLMGSLINAAEGIDSHTLRFLPISDTMLNGLLEYMRSFGMYPWSQEDATAPRLRKKPVKPQVVWLN